MKCICSETEEQRFGDPNCPLCKGHGRITGQTYIKYLQNMITAYDSPDLIRENLKHKERIYVLETLLKNMVEQIYDVADISRDFDPMEQ